MQSLWSNQDVAGATIIGNYRYNLWRVWDEQLPRVLWVMLNPSTADASQSDPTLRRILDFSKQWGYGSLEVVNLYAWRSPDPKTLLSASDPVGSFNNQHIIRSVTNPNSHTSLRWQMRLFVSTPSRHIMMGLQITMTERTVVHPLFVGLVTSLYGHGRMR